MIKLSTEQTQWVESTLRGLTVEQKVGQLLCPDDRKFSKEEWVAFVQRCPVGSAFFSSETEQSMREKAQALQAVSAVPMLLAGDLEHGVLTITDTATLFPYPMAYTAAGDLAAVRDAARHTAREARAAGLNWTFSPIVDLNLNFRNPITMNRAFSDDTQKVSDFSTACIEGLQEDQLLAATAKHFPGDGVDDRDQHRVTSVNALSYAEWQRLYRPVWDAAIESGVMAVMSGHISLPAYQGFLDGNIEEAPPATLCSKLQIQLLREELGFEGVIVSDAAPMVGLSSRVPSERAAIENIKAGSNIYLFANEDDYTYLLAAVNRGELSQDLIDERVRRVLEMKARLHLNVPSKHFSEPISADQLEAAQQVGRTVAEKAVTIQRKVKSFPEISKRQGCKVLTATVHKERPGRDPVAETLPEFDRALREAGAEVDYVPLIDHNELKKRAGDYDYIFINLIVTASGCHGMDNLGWSVMKFWRAFYPGMDNVYFTSFGSPYMLYELPSLPNLICTYSADVFSQRAAASYWLGKIEAPGREPVRLPRLRICESWQKRIEMVDTITESLF